MICAEFERLAALGDGLRLEQHLGQCAVCCELTAAMREIGTEQISEGALTAVRVRVLEGLGRRRKLAWWWLPVAATACAAVWMMLLAWPRPAPVPPPRLALRTPPAPALRLPVHRPVIRKRRPVPVVVAAAKPAQRITIKMLTDDPNIVVYWIVDPGEKGEAR